MYGKDRVMDGGTEQGLDLLCDGLMVIAGGDDGGCYSRTAGGYKDNVII